MITDIRVVGSDLVEVTVESGREAKVYSLTWHQAGDISYVALDESFYADHPASLSAPEEVVSVAREAMHGKMPELPISLSE